MRKNFENNWQKRDQNMIENKSFGKLTIKSQSVSIIVSLHEVWTAVQADKLINNDSSKFFKIKFHQ